MAQVSAKGVAEALRASIDAHARVVQAAKNAAAAVKPPPPPPPPAGKP